MPAAPPPTAPVGAPLPTVAPPSRPPPPTREISVSSLPSPIKPPPPPKPGSARERMEAGMNKYAKDAAGRPVPEAEPTDRPGAQPEPEATSSPEPPSSETPETPEPGSPVTEPGSPSPEAAPPTGEPAKGKKVSPWKLVDEYKGKLAKAEQEISTLKSSVLPEADRAKVEERVKSIEARNAELEEHIRYVDYTRSKEFQEKFEAPYESAWKRQMGNLKDIAVPLDGGQSRPFSPEDLLSLVNMERGQARKVAEELFGDDAEDVLAARLECRRLWDEREQGLAEAKKSGAERVSQAQQQYKAAQEAVAKAVKQTWDTVNSTLLEDPEIGQFFKPREGDQEWNQRLAKGFQLVDTAFNQDPRDPKLTPEQRASVVRRHAAVRNRAASWGALRHELTKARDQIKALEKTLSGYKGSTPPAGGTTPASQATATTGRGIDRLMAEMDKISKPM
jgi:hypothetical protein